MNQYTSPTKYWCFAIINWKFHIIFSTEDINKPVFDFTIFYWVKGKGEIIHNMYYSTGLYVLLMYSFVIYICMPIRCTIITRIFWRPNQSPRLNVRNVHVLCLVMDFRFDKVLVAEFGEKITECNKTLRIEETHRYTIRVN